MKVSSPVGEFPFHVERLRIQGGRLRIEGAMGAWPSHVEVGPSDVLDLVRLPGIPPLLGAAGAASAALVARRLVRRRVRR